MRTIDRWGNSRLDISNGETQRVFRIAMPFVHRACRIHDMEDTFAHTLPGTLFVRFCPDSNVGAQSHHVICTSDRDGSHNILQEYLDGD